MPDEKMMELLNKVMEIIRLNIDFISTLKGIDKDHCDRLPEAIEKQLKHLFVCSKENYTPNSKVLGRREIEKIILDSVIGDFAFRYADEVASCSEKLKEINIDKELINLLDALLSACIIKKKVKVVYTSKNYEDNVKKVDVGEEKITSVSDKMKEIKRLNIEIAEQVTDSLNKP